MRNIKTQFDAGTLKSESLLLEKDTVKIAEIPAEVEKLASKLGDFGIRNSTVSYIDKSRNTIASETMKSQQKKVKQDGLQMLMNLMFPFTIIPYKIIHEIANEYNLIISSLSYYNKPINLENVEELQVFKDLIAKKRNSFGRVRFPVGSEFSFANDCYNSVVEIDFTNYFNIVAPRSHFDFKGDNILQIGREVKAHEKCPGFQPRIKFNIPEPTDPIIVAPFEFLGKLYGFVVTAWDEVADDRRIRAMIK